MRGYESTLCNNRKLIILTKSFFGPFFYVFKIIYVGSLYVVGILQKKILTTDNLAKRGFNLSSICI